MPGASLREISVSSLRLFGSTARGESDGWSDNDLLIVMPHGFPTERIREVANGLHETKNDISVYTEQRYRQMHAEGHLFTWHIFKESRSGALEGFVPQTPDLIMQLGAPSAYRESHVDSQALITMLTHCTKGLGSENASEVFEAGILYVISRNLSIIASWRLGCLSFSVRVPFLVGRMLGCPYPLDEATYLFLRQSRKATIGGVTPPFISQATVIASLQEIDAWAARIHSFIFGEVYVS